MTRSAQLATRGLMAAVAIFLLAIAGCERAPVSKPMPPLNFWVLATGKSMLPTFPERAYVQVALTPYDELKIGDTVIFWDYTVSKTLFIHHRIVAKQGGSFIAQGDNPDTNKTADRAWVTRDNYIARTTGFWQLSLQ